MASIEERRLKSGKTSYKAEVVIRIDGKRHKKTATFARRTTAAAWAKRVEDEIRTSGREIWKKERAKEPTVADAVRRYVENQNSKIGSTKAQVLQFFIDGRSDICGAKLRDIEAADIRALAGELSAGGRGAATVSSYLTHLCYVLSNAEDDFGRDFAVDQDALIRGRRSARRAGLAGKPRSRERRPTVEELDALMSYFVDRTKSDARTLPMHLILPFSIFAVRRQSEILSLRWQDIDGSDAIVRGMKDPRRPEGRDRRTELTEEAQRIIGFMPRGTSERVFPFNSDTVSRLFTQACQILNIEDLRFHDMRHEGVSWLRERGWSTSHVMLVSGHSATSTLDRYSQLRERGDKYDRWRWWPVLEGMHTK